jgi:hypothetical protein
MCRASQFDPRVRFFVEVGDSWGNNSTSVRGDVAAEVTKPKRHDCGDLIIRGHSLLGETLLKRRLLDALDLASLGRPEAVPRDDRAAKLKLAATESFSTIAKVTYESHC